MYPFYLCGEGQSLTGIGGKQKKGDAGYTPASPFLFPGVFY